MYGSQFPAASLAVASCPAASCPRPQWDTLVRGRHVACVGPSQQLHYWGWVSHRETTGGAVQARQSLARKLFMHKPCWGTVQEESCFASNGYLITSDCQCILSDWRLSCFKSAILSCTGEEVDCPVLSLYLCCFEAINIMWVMRSDLLVKCILCAWYYGSGL